MPIGGGLPGRALAAALAVVLVGWAGCSDDSDDTDDTAPTSTTVGGPIEGGTLRLGIAGPLVVDPIEASLASPSDLMVLDLLHDGLTRIDGDGEVQPALATRWVSNADHTAYRFRLDPERTFASGDPVTPEAVVASIERVMQAGDSSLSALSLESVEGFAEFTAGDADHVSGLSADPDGVVRIALRTPLSVLPEILSNPILSVVDASSLEEGDLDALDLTGSWSLASATEDELRVERREGVAGHLDAVDLRAFDDGASAYEAFEDGVVDWAPVPSERHEDAVEAYGDDAFTPFHAELFFGMNLSSPNLGNPFLRKAITLAIDRDALVADVYPDLAEPLATVVPAGVAGHDPDRCPACAPDADAAAAIIEERFADKDVPTIRIDFDESSAQEDMAERIADDLEAAGIPTELRPLSLDEYKQFVVSGEQELFSFGWIGAYASPDAYLAPLFGSAANDNLTSYRSAEVDGLLGRARAGLDPSKDALRWERVEAVVLRAWVVIPIAQFRTQVVVADRVQGLEHAVDGTVDWAQVQLLG